MNKLSNETKTSMGQRIVTAIILIAICLPCLLIGHWFFAILVFVASFFACHEFINAPKNKAYNLFLHLINLFKDHIAYSDDCSTAVITPGIKYCL